MGLSIYTDYFKNTIFHDLDFRNLLKFSNELHYQILQFNFYF